jgi:uncharacterized flavoprotein (TIGR03862 family)
MAAEALVAGGVQVDVHDAMPSAGRKFLLAGKGGLNLTHSEPLEALLGRYGARRAQLAPLLDRFDPSALREWAAGLGIETFVGTSGRVFPKDLKAAPLLRAWLHRLRARGVRLHMRQRWLGWHGAELRFATPDGERLVETDATVLALGGASWPRLGSDGAWVPLLRGRGVDIAPLEPSNCGFDVGGHEGAAAVGWSGHFAARYAGRPVKPVLIEFDTADGAHFRRQGEFVVTAGGVEGSLVYAASAAIRDTIAARGAATIRLDLLPDRSAEAVLAHTAAPRGGRSLATQLKRLGIAGVKAGLLHEVLPREALADPARLTAAIKSLPLRLVAPRPVGEAISSAGGVRFEALDARLMLRALPGVFCAGEMLDWEAPTGGYLLNGCMASGRVAGDGALDWLAALRR